MQQQQTQGKLRYKETTRVMRKAVKKWRDEQIALNPYCYVTGSTDSLEVHHSGLSFSQIFKMAHSNLDIQFHKYIFDYTYDESTALKNEIIRLHDEVDPIVLTHSVHLELHQIFGLEVSRQDIDSYIKNYHVYTKK